MKTLTDATQAPDIPVADLVMEFRQRAAYSLGKYGPQASEARPILDAELSRLTSGANHAAMNRKRKPEFERDRKSVV